MPTSTQWRDYGVQDKTTLMNSHIFFDLQGVNNLANRLFDPSFPEVVLGDYTKWVLSLLYFPFDLRKESTLHSSFIIGGLTIPIQCYSPGSNYDYGFTLGEYYYAPKYNDYRDFEPYTTLQIYLPFYGYVDVAIADVIGKYIQFRLEVDFMTGQAMYTIGVNNASVSSPSAPFWFGTNDAETVILSKYIFSLGVTIPVSSSGMAEAIRNITMASIRGVALATGHYFVAAAGLTGGSSTSTNKIVWTERGSKNRQIQARTRTETTTTDYNMNKYERGRAINSCFESASDALNAMYMRSTTEKADNVFVDSQGSKSIQIVRRFAKLVNIDPHYSSLYGLPLGETRQLATLKGYTEVTAIHFEGEGFASATNEEIAMLEQEFSDGIILPDDTVVPV